MSGDLAALTNEKRDGFGRGDLHVGYCADAAFKRFSSLPFAP
jgi:hypothetical protein